MDSGCSSDSDSVSISPRAFSSFLHQVSYTKVTIIVDPIPGVETCIIVTKEKLEPNFFELICI